MKAKGLFGVFDCEDPTCSFWALTKSGIHHHMTAKHPEMEYVPFRAPPKPRRKKVKDV